MLTWKPKMDNRIARSVRAAWYCIRAYFWVAIPFGLILEYEFWTSGSADGAIGAFPGIIMVAGAMFPLPVVAVAGGVLGAIPGSPRSATIAPAAAAVLGVVGVVLGLAFFGIDGTRGTVLLVPLVAVAFWFAGKRFVERVVAQVHAVAHRAGPAQPATGFAPVAGPPSAPPFAASGSLSPEAPPANATGPVVSSTFDPTLFGSAAVGAALAIVVVVARSIIKHFLQVAFPAYESPWINASMTSVLDYAIRPTGDALLALGVGAAIGALLFITRTVEWAQLVVVGAAAFFVSRDLFSHSLSPRNIFVAGATLAIAWLLGASVQRRLG